VILEFPSYNRAKAWYESDGYRVAMAIRRSASKGTLILVEGVDPVGTT
jgi:uncharacterized protein (DUF1330 family)